MVSGLWRIGKKSCDHYKSGEKTSGISGSFQDKRIEKFVHGFHGLIRIFVTKRSFDSGYLPDSA
jgi:hypothetical protein